jgi:hypothetical protein
MNIIFDIGIYVLASSFIMVAYVWFKSFRHSQSGYDQISETNDVTEETQSAKENLAA